MGNLGQLGAQPEQDYIRWGKEYSEFITKAMKFVETALIFFCFLFPRLRSDSYECTRSAYDMLEHRQSRHRLA